MGNEKDDEANCFVSNVFHNAGKLLKNFKNSIAVCLAVLKIKKPEIIKYSHRTLCAVLARSASGRDSLGMKTL